LAAVRVRVRVLYIQLRYKRQRAIAYLFAVRKGKEADLYSAYCQYLDH